MIVDEGLGIRKQVTPGTQAGNTERSFGISVGTVLIALAAYFLWRDRFNRAELLAAVGATLVFFALVRPAALKLPSDLWWRASRALGYVNGRLLLTVIFVVAFIPIGIITRLISVDPLRRRRTSWTGWSSHPRRYRSPEHYSRMY